MFERTGLAATWGLRHSSRANPLARALWPAFRARTERRHRRRQPPTREDDSTMNLPAAKQPSSRGYVVSPPGHAKPEIDVSA